MAEGGLPSAQAPGRSVSRRTAGRQWLRALLLFALALTLRLGYVLTLPPALQWDDERHYDEVARHFLEGDGLILDDRHQVDKPPAYPLFLAGLYLINYHLHLTSDVLLVRLVQAVVGAATVLLIWWSAGRLFGRGPVGGGAALVAGLLSAVYPFFIYYSGVLLSETLAIFFLALALGALVALARERAPRYAVAAGAALGLLALTKASFLLLAPFLGLVWLAARKPRRRALTEAAVLVCVWAVVLLPWVVRNYLATGGHFVPGTLTGGWSLYEGAGPGADGGPRMERVQWPAEVWPREASPLDEYQADRYLTKAALAHVLGNPGEALRLAARKFVRLWNIFPNFEGFRSPLYRLVSILGYVPVMVLALVGLVARRRSWRRLVVLLVPAVYLSGVHSLFVGSIRYREPAMVGLLVLAGAGGAVFLSRWPTERRRRRRWGFWAAFAVFSLVVFAVALRLREAFRPENVVARLHDELARLWGGVVVVGSADFGPLRGLEAQGVVLYSQEDPQRVILRVNRLEASADPQSLVAGKLVLTELHITGGELLLRRTPAGWELPREVFRSVSRRTAGGPLPRVTLEKLALRLEQMAGGGPKRQAELGLLDLSAKQGAGGSVRLTAKLRSGPVGDWEGQATLSPKGDYLVLSASCSAFRVTPASLAALPTEVEAVVRTFAPRGQASFQVSAEVPLGRSATRPTPHGDARSEPSVKVVFEGPSLAYKGFPYRFPWTRGEVSVQGGEVTIASAEGRDGDLQVHLAGTVTLPGPPTRAALSLEVTKGTLNEKLLACLPEKYHALWRDLEPGGRLNLAGTIRADDETGGRTAFVLDITPLDSRLCYLGFPYAVYLTGGRLHYEGGRVDAEGLSGETPGGAPVTLSGYVEGLDGPRPNPFITVEAPRLALDGRLRQAFAPRYRELWDRAAPEGEVSARCVVSRSDGGRGPVGVEAVVTLLGAAVTDREFPYRLAGLRGQVAYAGDTLQVAEVQGTHGPAQVALSGEIRLGDQPEVSLEVRGTGVPLDDDLKQALPAEVQRLWVQLDPAGTVAVVCRLSGELEAPARSVTVTTEEASLCYEGFRYPLLALAGELHYEGGELTWDLKSRPTGEAKAAVVTLSGRATGLPEQPVAHWTVEARDVELDQTLSQAIASTQLLGRIWQEVGVELGAQANVICQVKYEDRGATVEQVEVELTQAQVTFPSLPYPLEGVKGRVIYKPGLLTVEQLGGRHGTGSLKVVKGSIDNLEHEPSFELHLVAQKLPLDEALRGLLSPELQKLWDQFAPSGTISFPKETFSVSGGPTNPTQRLVTYQGDLELEDLGFTLGFDFREVNGRISLTGQVLLERAGHAAGPGAEGRPAGGAEPTAAVLELAGAEGASVEPALPPPAATGSADEVWQVVSHSYQGTARLTDLVASSKPLKDLTGSFLKEGTMLGFSSVRAKMYDGELRGAARLDLEPGRMSYGCRLHLADVALGPFVRDTFDYHGEELAGRLAGDVVLQGTGATRRELVGQGTLNITEGELYRMPVLLRVLNLLHLSPPQESAFSQAAVDYAIMEQEVIISEMDLWGRGLNIFGSGRIKRNNELEFVLYTGFGRGEFPHVPGLSDLVELVGKQLMRLEVEGTFSDPVVITEPLSPLSAPLIDVLRSLGK